MEELKEGTKKCTKCGQFKGYSEFGKKANSADGYQIYCKSCMAEYNRLKYKERIHKAKSIGVKETGKESERKLVKVVCNPELAKFAPC